MTVLKKESIINNLKMVKGGDMVEVRLLNVPRKGTVSGYYTDYNKLFKDINPYNGKNNIFIIFNEIDKTKIKAPLNQLTTNARSTTRDPEIRWRKWLMIDLDPIRETNTSSSAKELEMARELKDEIELFLETRGFTEPMVAMSGNGYHLFYPIIMENNRENTALIKKFLQVLSKKFSNDDVEVDVSTYNAARLTKLYGTVAVKGEATEERPHREAIIESYPKRPLQTKISLIEDLVQEYTSADSITPAPTESAASYQGINLKEWLEKKNIEVIRTKPADSGDGICYVLKRCPWNKKHTDQAAYAIQYSNGAIAAGCHHKSCHDNNWKTLRQLYESPGNSDTDYKDMSVAEMLLHQINIEKHFFFHDASENAYVRITEQNIVYQVQGIKYKQYLRNLYYKLFQKTISKTTMQQVIDTLEAQAVYDGSEQEVHTRCAMFDGQIYYHLNDTDQQVVCINEDGYSLITNYPVPFIVKNTLLPQVPPQKGTLSFEELTDRHWHFQSEDDRLLHSVLLISRFIPTCPSPIILYMGDHGSAKTSSMKQDRLLIDPSSFLLRPMPHSKDDLALALSQYMSCFDNVDGISPDFADILCIACTGGVHAKRKLFTDDDEVGIPLFTRIAFSSINMVSNRPDLYDRSISLILRRLTPEERKTEEDVLTAFKADIPLILHEAFNILSKAMKIYKTLELKSLPRMADFCKWGYAILESMGYDGSFFIDIYNRNQTGLSDRVIEEDLLATTLLAFLEEEHYFKGKASDLLKNLTDKLVENGMDTRGWITSPISLSTRINELKPLLEQRGIKVNRGKTGGDRYIELEGGENHE